ncbi:L,D-transpeptidase [Pseudonocardia sp. NPDC049635]|uniref:L,D-transpeptidase n=1 Tax=Pseudonocardia sp. NPDC049635 TaxID=3155506 RepID=UPI0033D0B14A
MDTPTPADRQRTRRVAALALGITTVAGVALGGTALAASPAALAAWSQPLVPGTPCSITASACVDLDTQQSWLITDGEVVRGPVPIASGGQGRETPVGHSLRVYRKEASHVSGEFLGADDRPAQMPWSVFFEDGGIAFHGGDPERASAGCIHLDDADARAYFEHLQIGDQVQVVSAAEEAAARDAMR